MKRNAWAIALFGVIAVFVGARLWRSSGTSKAAATPTVSGAAVDEPPASHDPTPVRAVPPPPELLALAQRSPEADSADGAARAHVDIDTIIPKSAWVDPVPVPSTSIIPARPMEIPGLDPQATPADMRRDLKVHQSRERMLTQQLRDAQARGDEHEIARLTRMLEYEQRMIGILKGELGS